MRLPPAPHKRLNDRAEACGIGLNALIVELLATGAGGEGAGE